MFRYILMKIWKFLDFYIFYEISKFLCHDCAKTTRYYFNSKRFWNKNINPRTVFGIMVSRSLDVSLHFNEKLNISGFLYIFRHFAKINENRLFERVWTFFSKVFQKLLQFGTGFWSFLDVSEHFKKSTHFLNIRNRLNPFNEAFEK